MSLKLRLIGILSIVVVFLLWSGSWYLLRSDPSRGTFGDMFGAVNALFAGLAFAGLIFAILQREELELQRNELKLTREELSGQRKQLEEQNKTLRKQTFEDTFFQLLRLQNELTQSLSIAGTPPALGRECFRHLYNEFRTRYMSHEASGNLPNIKKAYNDFFHTSLNMVGHYYRNLYQILKFVKNSDLVNKLFYTNLVRSQLSSFELALLFYNCLSDLGETKFKPLIEEFAFLENLNQSLLLSLEDAKLYDLTAFQETLLHREDNT